MNHVPHQSPWVRIKYQWNITCYAFSSNLHIHQGTHGSSETIICKVRGPPLAQILVPDSFKRTIQKKKEGGGGQFSTCISCRQGILKKSNLRGCHQDRLKSKRDGSYTCCDKWHLFYFIQHKWRKKSERKKTRNWLVSLDYIVGN